MRHFTTIQERVRTYHSIVSDLKTSTGSPGFGYLRIISSWAVSESLLGLQLPRELPPEEIKGTESFILKYSNTMSNQPRESTS